MRPTKLFIFGSPKAGTPVMLAAPTTLTAEYGEWREKTESAAQHFIIELAVLTVLILALVISLVLLRKTGAPVVAKRA